jgi:peptide/nickel transport system permease protein
VLAYLVRRLGLAVVVLWAAVTITFVVIRVVPGDPALVLLGDLASEAQIEAARIRFGLDRPLPEQYLTFLLAAAMLDFGDSLVRGGPALGHVLGRLPATFWLGFTAMALIVVLAVPVGVAAGRVPGTWRDRGITTSALVGQSLPEFWVGIVLILVFARHLQILPSGGDASWRHVVLPALTLALPFLSVQVRLVRSGLIEVMGQAYVQTARAKGLREPAVLRRHALRNALIPAVTVGGLQLGHLLGGTVIVETVFAWPGIGQLLISAISYRDFPVIQACMIVITAIVVLVNLVVDLLYTWLDPRIRLGGGR